MKDADRDRIFQQLQAQQLLTQQQLKTVFQESQQMNVDPLQAIIARKLVDEELLAQIISQVLNVPYADLRNEQIERDVLNTITQGVAENYFVVPFQQKGNMIHVGMVDPQNYTAIEALDFIAHNTHVQFTYYLISNSSYQAVLKQYASLKAEVAQALEDQIDQLDDSLLDEDVLDAKDADTVKNAPVSKTVAVMLRYAVEGKASDVHIEPADDVTRVRYRQDGVLHTSLRLPKSVHSALVARIKVLANLKLDETRLPQDGRFRMTIDGRDVDFRVSTMPLVGTEKVVLRILDKETGVHSLEDLGYADHNLQVIHSHLQRPHGMILITGPTGSGKSTTLYSMLQILNSDERNIITLEDPVEYNMPGIAQSQIRPEIDLTFARGLRSVLRQDPDIIMVGEIRDNETAELAVHAALTGHMLLSTLHTNDAIGAVPRLVDMEIEPFLISSALNLLIAQRLVRRICTECVAQVEVSTRVQDSVIRLLGEIPQASIPQDIADIISGKAPFHAYAGSGCSQCDETGYRGRVAAAEVIEGTERLAEIIAAGKANDMSVVEKELQAQGMVTMQQDGLIKAVRGLTTIEEVLTLGVEVE